jgi:hypothetical protein
MPTRRDTVPTGADALSGRSDQVPDGADGVSGWRNVLSGDGNAVPARADALPA